MIPIQAETGRSSDSMDGERWVLGGPSATGGAGSSSSGRRLGLPCHSTRPHPHGVILFHEVLTAHYNEHTLDIGDNFDG